MHGTVCETFIEALLKWKGVCKQSKFAKEVDRMYASSKLLIWGGSINKLELRCMSKSDPLVHWGPRKIVIWLTGVCHSLIARVVLGTPFYALELLVQDPASEGES